MDHERIDDEDEGVPSAMRLLMAYEHPREADPEVLAYLEKHPEYVKHIERLLGKIGEGKPKGLER
jgi:hypothetical protein